MQTNKQENTHFVNIQGNLYPNNFSFFFNIKDKTFCEHCKNGYRMAVAHFTLISY